ncbi:MAG: hypothetical protein WA891_16255 [Acidobacteriaceae bacterium]
MKDGYEDCRLKIHRAKEHVQDLQTRMAKITADDSYVITVQPDPNGGDDLIKLSAVQVIPGEILCVIGDAVHNLRTALDFAMNHMVGTPTRFTKFTVCDTRNELIASVNGGLNNYASKDVIDFIVNFVQPYQGGRGEAIWAIHELDIKDKHGTLIAHRELKFVTGIKGIDERSEEFEVPTWLIVDGLVATEKLGGHQNVKITNKGRPSLQVIFGKGMPMEGHAVLPTLAQFVHFVGQLIEDISIGFPVWLETSL